jgi:hypothetical protein
MPNKPSKSFSSINQNALKAFNLVQAHRASLEPRLPSGLIDGLTADLEALGVLVPGAGLVKSEAKVATVKQNVVLAEAYGLVTATRNAVQAAEAPKEVRAAFGVGRKVNPKTVKDVKGALEQILAAAAQDESGARALGLLPLDLDRMRAALDKLTGADSEQEEARAKSPLTTKARNETAKRVLSAVARIAGAGVMQFAADKTVRAEFQGLPSAGNPKRKAKKKAKA